MNAPAFDTLAYVKHLTAAGMPEKQAEAVVTGHVTYITEQLATKLDIAEIKRDIAELKRDMKQLETSLTRDLKQLETSLTRDLKELETSLKRDNKELEARLTLKLTGIVAAIVGLITALDKFI